MRSKQMHKCLSIRLLLLMFVLPLFSLGNEQAAADLFKKGNEAYAKARYEEALQSYQQVIESGYQSAAVYFNLGNVNYKLGNMPSAILNYEKAYKLNPADADVKLNLQLANLKITDKIETIPEFFLTSWWKELVSLLSVSAWSVLSVVCMLMGFLLLVVYLFSVRIGLKKPAFYGGLALCLMGLIGLIMASIQQHDVTNRNEAIVFTGTVNVKSGPADGQKTLFVIHEGTKVSIQEKDSNWIKVELPNGNVGWIAATAVKEI